jgi:hypothetical protein
MKKTLTDVQNRLFFLETIKRYLGFKKYVDEKLAHLSHAETKMIEPILIKYPGIFHDDEDNDFKSSSA